MNIIKWLFCSHEYKACMFQSPTRQVINLTCVHCGKELIYPLTEKWNE